MRVSRRPRPAPARVASFMALFVALAAPALAGSDSVVSGDIVDGAVKSADVANDDTAGALVAQDVQTGALTPLDIAPNSIGAAKIVDNSLSGDRFATASLNGSDIAGLTGADIIESELTGVPEASDTSLLDGIDSSVIVTARGDAADTGQCSGSLTYIPEICADVVATLPATGAVLVTVTGTWHAIDTGLGPLSGVDCAIHADDIEIGRVELGAEGGHEEGAELPLTFQALTAIGAGGHEFDFTCDLSTSADDGDSDIDSAYISVLAMGSG